MILPIVAYGHKSLKTPASIFELKEDAQQSFISNMFETMYHAKGVGLAGPQVNLTQNIFIIDSGLGAENKDKETQIIETFINAEIIDFSKETSNYEEGCLSIPGVYGDVTRPHEIRVRYYNKFLEEKTQDFSGFAARIIQHEYDHIRGILFTDLLSPLRKQLISKKLNDIRTNKITPRYKMLFASK
ncbi:MAG: peptide deformylase [Chitinophagales bacterium]|jgi:peptide deformylase|nr:peptide deformylase [Chitinophagales bacterium]